MCMQVRGHVLDLVFETDDILETEDLQVDDPTDPISVERSTPIISRSSSLDSALISTPLPRLRWLLQCCGKLLKSCTHAIAFLLQLL